MQRKFCLYICTGMRTENKSKQIMACCKMHMHSYCDGAFYYSIK